MDLEDIEERILGGPREANVLQDLAISAAKPPRKRARNRKLPRGSTRKRNPPISEDVWLRHWPDIIYFYVWGGLTLRVVREMMLKPPHNFNASEKQYKDRFDKLGVKKKMTEDKKRKICLIDAHRSAQGKSTIYRVYGVEIRSSSKALVACRKRWLMPSRADKSAVAYARTEVHASQISGLSWDTISRTRGEPFPYAVWPAEIPKHVSVSLQQVNQGVVGGNLSQTNIAGRQDEPNCTAATKKHFRSDSLHSLTLENPDSPSPSNSTEDHFAHDGNIVSFEAAQLLVGMHQTFLECPDEPFSGLSMADSCLPPDIAALPDGAVASPFSWDINTFDDVLYLDNDAVADAYADEEIEVSSDGE